MFPMETATNKNTLSQSNARPLNNMYMKTSPKVPTWEVISRAPRKVFRVHESEPEVVCSEEYSQLSLFAQLKPAWLALKVLGLLPIFIEQQIEGSKAKKVVILLAQAAYAAGFYLTFAVISGTRMEQMRDEFENKVKLTTPWITLQLMSATILMPHVLIAPLHWLRMRQLLRFIKDWDTFQAQFLEVTRHPLRLRMRRWTTAVMTLVVTGSFAIGYVLSLYFLLEGDYWGTAFIICAINQINLLLVVWVLLCQASGKAADQLASRFKSEFLKSGAVGEHVIYSYYRTWLRLRQLTRDIGTVFYSVFNLMVMFWLALLLLSAFQSAIFLRNRCSPGRQSGMIVLALLAMGSIYFFCHAASQATEAISDNFMSCLVDIKVEKRDLQKQLQDFQQAVGLHDAVISLGGYFEVTRGLVVSMLASFATYSIVLFQSTSASDSNDCGDDVV